jgi:hypothetical protein
MSKEAWFANFEYLQAEHPDMTDEDLSEMASERLRDQFADRADQLNDEKWERDYEAKQRES